MITTIAKRFTFDAAHFLPTVPADHKCHRMHGHTYAVELMFSGSTDDNGFCAGIDYGDIDTMWSSLHSQLDHRVLNEVIGLEVPSAEHLAAWIATKVLLACGNRYKNLYDAFSGVRVMESSSTWCELLRDPPRHVLGGRWGAP